MRQYRDNGLYTQADQEQYAKEHFKSQCLAHHQIEAGRDVRAHNATDDYHQQGERPQSDEYPVRRSVGHAEQDDDDVRQQKQHQKPDAAPLYSYQRGNRALPRMHIAFRVAHIVCVNGRSRHEAQGQAIDKGAGRAVARLYHKGTSSYQRTKDEKGNWLTKPQRGERAWRRAIEIRTEQAHQAKEVDERPARTGDNQTQERTQTQNSQSDR